ncbi:MAG: hypothetical protein ACW98X_25865 [Promethearchaeota archaeon]|jgi:hypothetical protein
MTTLEQFIENDELPKTSIDPERETSNKDKLDTESNISDVLQRLKELGVEVQEDRGVEDIPSVFLSNQVKLIQQANQSYTQELNKYNLDSKFKEVGQPRRTLGKRQDPLESLSTPTTTTESPIQDTSEAISWWNYLF